MPKEILMLLVGLKYVCDAVNITSIYSINGQNLFLEGSTGALLCRINQWRERMSWLVDKDKVAECVGPICTPISNGFGIYSFAFNIPNSTFEFSFLVSLKLRGRVITCFDGESSAAIKLDVKGLGAGFRGDPKVALMYFLLGLNLVIIIYEIYCKWKIITDCLRGRCSTEDPERQQSKSQESRKTSGSDLPLLNRNNDDNSR